MVFYNEVKDDDQGPIEVEKGEVYLVLRIVVTDLSYRVLRSMAFSEGT